MPWYCVIAEEPEAGFDCSPYQKNFAGQYVLLDARASQQYARQVGQKAAQHFRKVDLFRGCRIGRLIASWRKTQ